MKTVKQIRPQVDRLRSTTELNEWFVQNKNELSMPAVSYIKFKLYQLSPPELRPQPAMARTGLNELVEKLSGPLFTME